MCFSSKYNSHALLSGYGKTFPQIFSPYFYQPRIFSVRYIFSFLSKDHLLVLVVRYGTSQKIVTSETFGHSFARYAAKSLEYIESIFSEVS